MVSFEKARRPRAARKDCFATVLGPKPAEARMSEASVAGLPPGVASAVIGRSRKIAGDGRTFLNKPNFRAALGRTPERNCNF